MEKGPGGIDALADELMASVKTQERRIAGLLGAFEAEERRKADDARQKAAEEAARIAFVAACAKPGAPAIQATAVAAMSPCFIRFMPSIPFKIRQIYIHPTATQDPADAVAQAE